MLTTLREILMAASVICASALAKKRSGIDNPLESFTEKVKPQLSLLFSLTALFPLS